MLALIATILIATSSANAAPAQTHAQAGEGIALQKQAATRLTVIVEETFAEITRHLKAGVPFSEADARAFVTRAYARDGLVSEELPLIAVGAHSADPGYAGPADIPIKRGDFVLIELAAKKDAPGAIYADVTWAACACRTREVPPRIARVWGIVREARDRALSELKSRAKAGAPGTLPTGEEIDRVARAVVVKNRQGWLFPHATGHSLGEKDSGGGPNLKEGESRPLAIGQCFTVEPGIYYSAEFGVRSGVDVCLTPGGADITTGIAQREIRALLE